jgi:hypothetical protein
MTTESLLPSYTLSERSRELLMRSRALCWRALRARYQARELQVDIRQLRDRVRASRMDRGPEAVLIRYKFLR